jgi:hypothetical protein
MDDQEVGGSLAVTRNVWREAVTEGDEELFQDRVHKHLDLLVP